MALVMAVSLLPAVPAAAAAGDSPLPLNAYYTDKAMSMDGVLKEEHWLLRDRVGATPIGLLNAQEALYVALKTREMTVDVTANGKAFHIDLEAGAVMQDGEKIGLAAFDREAGTAEFELPMQNLGLLYTVGQETDFAIRVGADSYTGKVLMAEKAVKLAEDFDNIAAIGKFGSSQVQVYGLQGDSSLHILTGDMTDAGYTMHQPAWSPTTLGLDLSRGYEMSFRADFNDLCVVSPDQPQYAALVGFAIDARGEVYLRHSFTADKNGNLMVTQYENTADQTLLVDTGFDLPAKDVFVEILVDDDFNVEVRMNGKSVAKFATTTRRTAAGNIMFSTGTGRRDTSLPNKNDVEIYDVLVTQPAPNEQLGVSTIANSADLTVDGNPDEVIWSLPYAVGNTRYGLLYDAENLYIALNTDENQLDFTFGEQKATAKLGAKPTIALGYTMGSTIAGNGKGQYEIKIPLTLLKAEGKLPFTVTSGGVTRRSDLTFTNTVLKIMEYAVQPGDGKQDAIAYLNTDKVTMDGRLKENHWYTATETQGPAGSMAAGAGFLWDANYLYVGTQVFSASRPKALNLTVNGKAMTADVAAGTASLGEVVGDGQTIEWRIPVAELDLPPGHGTETDYKLEVVGVNGTSVAQGKLTMKATVVILGDTCDDWNTKDYTDFSATLHHVFWEQGDRAYDLRTDYDFKGNEYYQQYTPMLNYSGGAYEITIDITVESLPYNQNTLGWRGLCWEIREPGLQTRFALRSDGNDNVVMDMLYSRDPATLDTGLKFGDRAVIRVCVDENLTPALYVNDKLVGGFPRLDRTYYTLSGTSANLSLPRMVMAQVNYDRSPDADGGLSGINAKIHDMLWTQTLYTDASEAAARALETVTEDKLLQGADPEDVTKLNLIHSVSDLNSGVTTPITWKAVDKVTGQEAKNVNVETGVITRGADPLYFDLIATATYGGSGASKTFTFQTKGKTATGKIGLIVRDDDPRAGQVTNWGSNSFEYFDTTHNSLVLDQGASKQFNTITLYDADDVSRVNKQHLGVFVSNDGKNFEKAYNWLLHQDGAVYTIYNLNKTARYVKVHNYHDDLDNSGVKPSFYNAVSQMMAVSYNPNLPGANGAFAHKADYVVKNPTAKAVKDYPVFISLADLGAKAGQYKNGCIDFRFTIGERVLAYWYNGVDGFYVNVPEVAAGGSATVTAHWGCGSAADFSDAEAVFEVMYGNVANIDLTTDTGLGSHGRACTLPNGDIIVAGRTKDTRGNVGLIRSTDGGRTWNYTPEMVLKDGDFPGRALGFGGFLVDEEIGRVWLICYSGNASNPKGDYRLVLVYTDDSGKTWSKPVFLSNPDQAPVLDNDSILQNADNDVSYVLIYNDGIKLRDADGKGPNVDYVICYNGNNLATQYNCTRTIYSKDGGESWICGEDIYMEGVDAVADTAVENGTTEPNVTQLDDGRLYMLIRAQEEGNHYLWEAYSSDYGATWDAGYSKVISPNTSPLLTTYNGQRILLWTSMNSLGGKSYRRTPMHVGITTDNYQTYDHIVDIVFGTNYAGLEEMYSHMCQPSIAFTKDGKDAFVAFYEGSRVRRFTEPATAGFLIEDFQDMINYTKGGYEDFEIASLKYEGWLTVDGVGLEVSTEASVSGLRSMKLTDQSTGAIAHTIRQIPSLKAGTVGAKLMVPATNTDWYAFELKAGYNFTHMQHALAAIAIKGDGTVAICYDNEIVPVGKVTPGTWNDYAVSFDIAANMGKLYVNGKFMSDIKLETGEPMHGKMVEDVVREITSIQFMQTEATGGTGDCLYVDDVYVTELTEPLKRSVHSVDFADVKESDWHFNAVSFAVENGIMSGYNATTFGPNDTLTRAMVVQVLYNKEGQPALNGLTHSFSDVPANQWFNNAVTWGSNRGVVSGFGGGVFKPEDAVTIEQVAVILWNYSNTPTGSGDLNKVGSHSDWAANALKWAVGKGILENVPFTNATEKATRAQTAQMLTNYLRNN